jgi:hypothetical protein
MDDSSPPADGVRETLAAFVTAKISELHGPVVPCHQEDALIGGFAERFGAMAMPIAAQAFGPHQGMWMGAPVTVRRFAASQDAYFALPLLEEIES